MLSCVPRALGLCLWRVRLRHARRHCIFHGYGNNRADEVACVGFTLPMHAFAAVPGEIHITESTRVALGDAASYIERGGTKIDRIGKMLKYLANATET